MGRLRTATRWVAVGAVAAAGAAGVASIRRLRGGTRTVRSPSRPDQTTCLVTIDRPPAEVAERFKAEWPADDTSEGPGVHERPGVGRTVRTHQVAWRYTENGESYAGTARFSPTGAAGATELRVDVRAEKDSPGDPATPEDLEERIWARLREFKRRVETS